MGSGTGGITLVVVTRMKSSRPNRTSQRLLCWIFQRGRHAITCQVDRQGHRATYMVSVVPHWDLRRAAVATFASVAAALRHHAEMAEALREQGWTLASYTTAR